jgi:anti-sigma B factor antagonist
MTDLSYQGGATGLLQIHRTRDEHGVCVELVGELDLSSVGELDRHLREIAGEKPGRIVIDLGNLEFMDSTGLALLIRAHRDAQANGHRLYLRPGSHQVQRLFELTGVKERFTFEA